MTEAPEPAGLSRRRALSLFGLGGALGLAVPRLLLTGSAAEAQTIPPAFNQVDKPIPGEGNTARTPPQPDKPILSGDTGTRQRRLRRKRQQQQRAKRRSKPPAAQQPASEDKPKQPLQLTPPR
jgi:hypothetical protein